LGRLGLEKRVISSFSFSIVDPDPSGTSSLSIRVGGGEEKTLSLSFFLSLYALSSCNFLR